MIKNEQISSLDDETALQISYLPLTSGEDVWVDRMDWFDRPIDEVFNRRRTVSGINLLLIGEAQDDPWQLIFKDVSASLGHLRVADELAAISLIREQPFDIVIIDATVVEQFQSLVASVRMLDSHVKLVVATASPSWKQARDVFRAGAADYILKSMNKEKLLLTLSDLARN